MLRRLCFRSVPVDLALATLFLTPVVDTYMAQLQSWMQSRQGAHTEASEN